MPNSWESLAFSPTRDKALVSGVGLEYFVLVFNGSSLLGMRHERDMDDIPRRVRDRPSFAPLSPEDEQEFLRTQAGFEAAYRATGDPQVLWHALLHAWSSRQTIPSWVVWDIGGAVIKRRTNEEAERNGDRMRHVQRYRVIRDLRRTVDERTGKKYTKDSALDAAVEILAAQRAAVERGTIEKSYDEVRKNLERQGPASEYFYFVALLPEASALAPRADSTLYTADSTIVTADADAVNAGDTASAPWFMRIANADHALPPDY
jgi:hypothetical protein